MKYIYLAQMAKENTYRITAILKVETDVIANISASPMGRARIFVTMSVEVFRNDFIVFISDIMMCFTSDWLMNLRMRVTNLPSIFVDQGLISDRDFMSGTQQRENVQFADKSYYRQFMFCDLLVHFFHVLNI